MGGHNKNRRFKTHSKFRYITNLKIALFTYFGSGPVKVYSKEEIEEYKKNKDALVDDAKK